MDNDDLWGDLPESDNATNPAILLSQQASLLGSKTRNVLTGLVTRVPQRPGGLLAAALAASQGRTDQKEQMVELRFLIRCSALDNYTFHVLTLKYSLLTIFPVDVRNEASGEDYTCRSDDELRSTLQQVFASLQVRRVISALLREANSLTPSIG
ncbi:MAG: hypothetical protein KJ000_22270 [Pirellulaceae bacterium]|nr:hypothetical protein [Pirellulaceae bacterium]